VPGQHGRFESARLAPAAAPNAALTPESAREFGMGNKRPIYVQDDARQFHQRRPRPAARLDRAGIRAATSRCSADRRRVGQFNPSVIYAGQNSPQLVQLSPPDRCPEPLASVGKQAIALNAAHPMAGPTLAAALAKLVSWDDDDKDGILIIRKKHAAKKGSP